MKDFFKKVGIATIITFIITLLTGCGNSNSIVGTWEYYDGTNTKSEVYYTFNRNSTGSYTYYNDTKEFTYEDRGNKVVISYEGTTSPNEFDYSIENGVLTIKDSFGSDVKYKRK